MRRAFIESLVFVPHMQYEDFNDTHVSEYCVSLFYGMFAWSLLGSFLLTSFCDVIQLLPASYVFMLWWTVVNINELYCVPRYLVPLRSMDFNVFEFQDPVNVHAHRMYAIGTKLSVKSNVESIDIHMCGRCIKSKRCVRCQKVGTKRSSVCTNINHIYCQDCIQQIPFYLRDAERNKEELSKLLPDYSPHACTSFGGPYCWRCYTPGMTWILITCVVFYIVMYIYRRWFTCVTLYRCGRMHNIWSSWT